MKKLILLMSAFLLTTSAVLAQKPERRREMNPEKRAEKQTDMMRDELGLSPEQYQKVLVLNKERAQKRQDAMKAQRAEMKKQHEAFQEQLNAVLTPEQATKLSALREKRKEEFKAKRRERPRPNRSKE